MNIFDIQGLIDNTSTIYTKIEILPKVAGEKIITLTNEDSIKEWVYSDLRNVDKEGFIGQFVARTLDGELQDIADDFNIEDREIVLYLGIFSNHTAELVTQDNNEIITQSNEGIITEQGADILTYYKLGSFFVEKPESDEVRDNTKFQAMDYTILFNTPFNADFKDSEYTKSFNEKIEDEETVTALWLTQYTCKQVGMLLGTTTFRNSNFVISSNQFDSGYTCRDVIKSIAKLAITWARIGWDDKLYLDFDKQTTIEDYNVITNDNYYELTTQKDVYGEVNRILMGSSIVIGNSAYVEDAQSIENNGLTELDVYDNPILYTQELRQQAITSASSMLGLMYQPVEIETTGHPWLLGNELITVVDMEGNYLNTYALDRILTYNGHIRSKISSMVKTETESTYSYQGVENNDLEIKRSRVELDRQNQTLTSVMERTTTNESQISTMTQSINGISTNITSMSGDINSLQGNVLDLSGDIEDITSSLTTITGDISDLSSDLNGLSVSFDDFYDNEYIQTIADLQDQIDGAIEFWTGDAIPTLNNAPANTWTTEALKQEHIGDVYIVLSGSAQGANYRFVKDGNTWKWLEISDSQIGAVRELAENAMAKATANEADIVDLKATDVSLQASIDGISASVTTLETNVDELGEGYDAITTAERTVVGNPVVIEDCGEYLIKNLTIYGNMSQDNGPTVSAPQEIKSVTGEHNLMIYSKNLYHTPNNTQYDRGITLITDNNNVTLNGTSTGLMRFYLDAEPLSLSPGTYTFTCWVEGTTDYQYIPRIRFCNGNASDVLVSFYHETGNKLSETFTISSVKDSCEVWIDIEAGYTFEDYKIKIQLEKGSTSTDYSNLYIEPIDYAYNLSDLCLYGTNNIYDYIKYNMTDETWYLSRNIREFKVAEHHVTGYAGSDETSDYIHINVYESNGSIPINNIKSLDYNIFCNKYVYKGVVDTESDIPEEEGLFVRFFDSHGESNYYVYLSTLKTSMGKQAGEYISNADVENWVQTQDIVFYYVQEETEIEELTDNSLISDLDYIRNNAKLYDGHMIVQDTATTGITGNIGINYLTDTVFNGIYASRSELKITQNSISTTVSETVNAVVENIDNRVTDVANTLEQNSKDLSDKIDNINDSLGEYAKQSTVVTVTNSVQEIQTALNEQILVTQQIKEDGVEKVTTTTGFTFDQAGLTIDKTGSDTKTLVDEDGMTVYSKTGSEESILLNVDSQGVQTENLHVRTFTQIGTHTRLQDYEDGTAIFYIE
jgi:archaellum component FlaC